jgi:hypothetical protein
MRVPSPAASTMVRLVLLLILVLGILRQRRAVAVIKRLDGN